MLRKCFLGSLERLSFLFLPLRDLWSSFWFSRDWKIEFFLYLLASVFVWKNINFLTVVLPVERKHFFLLSSGFSFLSFTSSLSLSTVSGKFVVITAVNLLSWFLRRGRRKREKDEFFFFYRVIILENAKKM